MTGLFPEPAASAPPAEDEGPGLWGDTLPRSAPPVAAPQGTTPYRVLARKYRPVTFDQLIGQDAMVRTLTNAIATNRLPQAWMLTGVRGVGKTTTARIIARALNCTGPDGQGGPTITPCGACDSCRAILEDRHMDVQELDAASRTGVDDMREIIDGVRYGPVSARYKIYILDEVHMLSKNAFNALLKTLEEPPSHTRFIFATTEIRKVPVTILSRCQRFDLRRISATELAGLYARVAEQERVAAEPEALALIAQAADGSARDGLSLLDQAIARGDGTVTATEVKDMLGLGARGEAFGLFRRLLQGNAPGALESYAAMIQVGVDPLQLLQDFMGAVHLLTRAQILGGRGTEDLPEAERAFLADLATLKIPALTRAWQILLKGVGEVQTAPDPVAAAEMVLIRLAYAADLPLPADLVKQIRATPPGGPGGGAPAASPEGGGGTAARLAAMSGGTARTGAVVALAPQTATVAARKTEALPQPSTFREVAALFATNREGALHAQLYSHVRPVRCEPGRLEVQLLDSVPPGFLPRVAQRLTEWTGQRWMVSVAEAPPTARTLEEEDQAAEAARHARARSHPLMQDVLAAFPEARLVALRTKQTVTSSAPEAEADGSTASPGAWSDAAFSDGPEEDDR